MDDYKVLAQLADHHASTGGYQNESSLTFSIERHKEGMKAYSGQMFLELDEISNLMGHSQDMHAIEKEAKNARLLNKNDKEHSKSADTGKNTLNDKLLSSIENILTESPKPEKTMRTPLRFEQTSSASHIRENPFQDQEEEENPFTENESGGGAAVAAAKALAEQMKQ